MHKQNPRRAKSAIGLSFVLGASAILTVLPMSAPTIAVAAGTGATASTALTMAMHHYKKENFTKAASLFLDAYEIDPDPVSLFYAGRSQQRAFLLDDAKKTLNRFLSMAGKAKNKGAALEKAMRRARTHIAEIRQTKVQLNKAVASDRAKVKGAAPKVDEPKVDEPKVDEPKVDEPKVDEPTVAATEPAWRRATGWGLLVLGAASAGYGGWQFIDLVERSDKLDKQLKASLVKGKAAGLDKETYYGSRAELESDQTVAIVMTAVGAVAAGAGAYLLWVKPTTRTLAVTPHANGRGVLVTLRF
jgi:hypothetical protein